MNCAEHIIKSVHDMINEDRITRTQLGEIIEEALGPFCDAEDPKHFHAVNDKIHRLLAVSDPPVRKAR